MILQRRDHRRLLVAEKSERRCWMTRPQRSATLHYQFEQTAVISGAPKGAERVSDPPDEAKCSRFHVLRVAILPESLSRGRPGACDQRSAHGRTET